VNAEYKEKAGLCLPLYLRVLAILHETRIQTERLVYVQIYRQCIEEQIKR
jgi:hypothetical protein